MIRLSNCILLSLLCISLFIFTGCRKTHKLDIVSIGYRTQTAAGDPLEIDCTGIDPTSTNTNMYLPLITSSNAIPIPPANEAPHELKFYIKSGSTSDSVIIGEFTIVLTRFVPNSSNNYNVGFTINMLSDPVGFPSPTGISDINRGVVFWMTCTNDCSVRSNTGSSSKSSAPIFIELLPESMNGNVKLTGNLASNIRGIACQPTSP